MKNRFLIFGLALISGIFSINAIAQTKTNLTLKQCIETGIANNFDVKQRELTAQSDAVTRDQAMLNLLPNLNASTGYSFNQGRGIDPITNQRITQSFNSMNYNVSSNVVLFNGLAYQNYIKQTSLTYQASKMDWQQQKDNLTINIILAYLQILSNEDQLAQARNQADLSLKQVERLDVMLNQGAVKPSDLTDLKGQYNNDQLSIVNTENALGSAKINLCQLMNIPFSNDMKLERIDPATLASIYPDTPDKIYETALTGFAQIKAVDLRAQGAAKAIKVARGQLFPTLSFGAGLGSSYSSVATENTLVSTTVGTSDNYVDVGGTKYPVLFPQDNYTTSKSKFNDQLKNNQSTFYGFNLSIPIFNNWQQRNRIKQAKITYTLRDITAKTTRIQLNQSINLAYINMTSASERLKTLTDQVNAYAESFREAEIRFNEGVGTSIDYLLAKTRIDAANINLINARYDYVLRMKILDYYEGKPLW